MRRLWQHVAPHLPQPTSDAEVLATIHRARTEANSVPTSLRAYSHRWLLERDIPSGLPDAMKPAAERLYPRVASAVGVSVRSLSGSHTEHAKAVERVMSDAVAEAYADGNTDPVFVKARMQAARLKVA